MNKNNTKNNVIPVLEMFVSIQGEGKYTGEPSLFIRVSGCNLRCVFGGTRCDTPYSSFETEKPIYKAKNQDINGKKINASISFVPSVAGLIIASQVIKDILG